MTARGTRIAVVSVCVSLAVAGTLAVLLRLPPTPLRTPGSAAAPGAPVVSQAELEVLLGRVARSLEPGLRSKLAEAVLSESGRAGYDPLFILGLVSVESSFRTHVSSERGAYGLMQLQPSTFAWIAGREPDIGDGAAVSEDPVIDVRLAVRYFHWLEKRFPRRDEALMAYNAGPTRMRRYKRVGIPRTVRAYPRKVMREYQRFSKMLGSRQDPREVILARAD
ncbi:MAG TPA: lytic transglycosylase domain-containing protein [Myxococcales bacterium]|nr:lytic transglycosylase domain-containing protein [Myxococcales bacterium]